MKLIASEFLIVFPNKPKRINKAKSHPSSLLEMANNVFKHNNTCRSKVGSKILGLQSKLKLKLKTFPSLASFSAFPSTHPNLAHSINISHEPLHHRNHIWPQIHSQSYCHGVSTESVYITHIYHLHTFTMLSP